MGSLDQKVAIVTGGGTGIGRAIAIEFAQEGASAVICGRNIMKLEKVIEEIRSYSSNSFAIAADVSVKSQVETTINQTLDRLGHVDILVNNAAIIRPAKIFELAEQDWDEVLDINLKGAFLCIQAVAKTMMERKFGKIINISSISGRGGALNDGAAYCASKAGIILLTQVAAWELGSYNINVNCIAPGLTLPGMALRSRSPQDFEKLLEKRKKQTVLDRLGHPEDIAKTVVFLASKDSTFISGQVIAVDGGRTDRM